MVNFLQNFYVNNIGGFSVDTLVFIGKFYLVDKYISRYDLFVDKIARNEDDKTAVISLLSNDDDVCGYIKIENQKLNVKIIKKTFYNDENICEYLDIDKDNFCGCLREFVCYDYDSYCGDKSLDEIGVMNDVYFNNEYIIGNNGDTYYKQCICESNQLLEALKIQHKRHDELSNSIISLSNDYKVKKIKI